MWDCYNMSARVVFSAFRSGLLRGGFVVLILIAKHKLIPRATIVRSLIKSKHGQLLLNRL